MKLICGDQTVQFEKRPSFEEVIEKINELLDHKYYFSHFIVDEVEIFDDPEQYLLEELHNINQLEIVVRTAVNYINDILLTTEAYLKGAKPEMAALADGFYQSPSAEHWTNFSDMLEGMQWLNQIVSSIDGIKEKPSNWNEYLKLAVSLELELKNLEEAVENKDTILIADIIQYELLPLYESLEKEIQTTIDTEGIRNDVN